MYNNILIPTDGSVVANVAVDHAIDIAEKYDAAEIHALFVADTDAITYGLGTGQLDRIRQGNFQGMTELREDAEEATGYVAKQAEQHGLNVVEHHAGGRPHAVIADYVEEHDIDLIVMGSHGRSGLARALLGSVTERTLRSAHTPVLVVDSQHQPDTDQHQPDTE